MSEIAVLCDDVAEAVARATKEFVGTQKGGRVVGMGADGTPSKLIDVVAEDAALEILASSVQFTSQSVAFTWLLVLLFELINSGIEAVVDRVGTEHHELSGRAKDVGSAAVLLALVNAAVVWFLVLTDFF